MEAYLEEKELWRVIGSSSEKESLRSAVVAGKQAEWDEKWEKILQFHYIFLHRPCSNSLLVEEEI